MSLHHVVKAVPMHAHIKKGAKHILAHDKARAQKLIQGLNPHGPAHKLFNELASAPSHPRQHHAARASGNSSESIDVTDAGVTYTMVVGVGQPATEYTLLIDTGSSNTWVGADKAYTPTSTSINTGNIVNVSYGSGSFSGTEYEDQITIGSHVIKQQSIGVASKATGFQGGGVDGILGIGPVDITQGTVSNTEQVPTVTNNLFAQKLIQSESIGISFNPTLTSGAMNGELTFGAVDESRTTSPISYVPITRVPPAGKYWGIDQLVTYGDTPILQSSGIVDTGTTLLLIATDAFKAYQNATGAVLDSTTGLLTVTEAQFEKMQSLIFTIGTTTFEFTANAQIWPRSQNAVLGGEAGKIYLITADLGNQSGAGLDFINGYAFLKRFYSVYDTTNSRVGLATTEFTHATSN